MKTWTKILVTGIFLGVGFVGFGEKALARTNAQVPNYNLESFLNRKLLETFVPTDEEQNPEEDASYGGVPLYLFDQQFDTFSTGPSAMDYISSSIEGLQYINTKKLTVETQTYDLTPLANNQSIEELELFLQGGNGYGGYARNGFTDLSFMKYRLEQLKILKIVQLGRYFDQTAIIDLSGLSEHPTLEAVNITAAGGLQPASMKQGYRKYELFDPIILSSQFEGATINYSSEDETFSNTDGLLKWSAVPFDTETLHLSWTVTKGNFHFEGNVEIPIDWK